MNNHYETLGVSKNATADEIKSAYRKLAMKYHPDRNPGDKVAEEKFKEITAAYEVIGDENKRKQYDSFGSTNYGYSNSSQSSNNYDDDPLWQWMNENFYNANSNRRSYNSQSQNSYKHSFYYQTNYGNSFKKTNRFSSIVNNILVAFAGLFLFRFIPFLGIIGILLMIKGLSGIIKNLK